jgi:hypothetical protein
MPLVRREKSQYKHRRSVNQEENRKETLDLFVLRQPSPMLAGLSNSAGGQWPYTCMLLSMKERYLLILLAVLMVLSVGAFFFFVPILPAMASVVIVMALLAMFALGLHLGRESAALTAPRDGSQTKDSTLPTVAERFRDAA